MPTCSNGPGIVLGGFRYMTTAAHCFPLGASVSHRGTNYGYINWQDQTSGLTSSVDIEVGSFAGATNFWAHTWPSLDGANNPIGVSGRRDVQVGDWVCLSGAYSGYVCDVQVNREFKWRTTGSGRLIYGVAQIHNTAKSVAGPGDSGAPVLFWSGSARWAGSMLGKAAGYPFVNCPDSGRGASCASEVDVQRMDFTLSRFGATQ